MSLKKALIVSVLCCLMISSTAAYLAAAVASDYYQVITGGQYPGAPSFTIYAQDGVYYAKNQYGGISWSSTDVNTVIQNAINALPETGGEIHFVAQNFEFSSSGFTVPADVYSVVFSGEGQRRTRLDGQDLAGYTATVKGYSITFKDMSIYGGVQLTEASGVLFENCYLDYAGAAKYNFYVNATEPVYSLTISHCLVLAATSLGNVYVYVPNVDGAEAANIRIFDSELNWGTGDNIKFVNERDNSIYLRGCEVKSNHVEAGTGSAIVSFNTYGFKVNSNDIYGTSNTTEPLLDLDGNATVRTYKPKIIGNNILQFTSTAANGVYANNVYDLTLSDNDIDGQTWDLQMGSGSGRGKIIGNNFVSKLCSFSGFNHTVSSNEGFLIENSGYATMTAGTATVTITHGLAGTPNVRLASGSNADIRTLLPGSGTATTFAVNNYNNGTALVVSSDATIWWYAAISNSTLHP